MTTETERRADLVPGVMHCAKCKFQLVRVTLAVNLGAAIAGDSKTEPCPNGCGPLWPVTWEQYARQCEEAAEQMAERAIKAEKALGTWEPMTPELLAEIAAEQPRSYYWLSIRNVPEPWIGRIRVGGGIPVFAIVGQGHVQADFVTHILPFTTPEMPK